jgi:tetratricopeptide (TPR) repeat protein
VKRLLAALVLAAGCAPTYGDAYLRAMAAGQRAYSAGRYDEAAAAFERAAGDALRVKDRDEARFLEARAHERAGRWAEAEAAYRALLAASPDGPRSARAELALADLAIDHGDAERGYAMLLEAVRRRPQHGDTPAALRRLVDREEERAGTAASVAFLARERPRFRGTELEQDVDYALASALDRAGRREDARALYIATARAHPYPRGALTDDAWWHAAEIDLAMGRPANAIADLREMLRAREPSTMTGSYQRPRFSAAQLRIAEIYRDELRDHAAARRELRRLFDEHTTSILRDDALWAEARLALEDRDAGAACEVARLLVTDLPESRYAPCAHELCATAPRLEGRECAGYLERELRGEATDATE